MIPVDDGWHYGVEGGAAVGFCPEHPPHRTETEARLCFQVWVRSSLRSVEVGYRKCDVPGCGAYTGCGVGVVSVGIDAALCPEHQSYAAATVALGLDRPAGDFYRP